MENRIGLALSGGGYRATLFALGSLIRLNELGMLPKIKTITSVSGGAITAGFLAYKWDKLYFDETTGIADNFFKEVTEPLINFCEKTIDIPSVLKGILSFRYTIGDMISKKYDEYLFNNKLLKDIASKNNAPEFIFYGTNYDTGVSVLITKEYLSDYRIGKALNHHISLSEAVGISSSFPPFFSPVVIDGSKWEWVKTEFTDLYHIDRLRKKLLLCDGGLYDNLGIEWLWKTGKYKNYDTVFVCDSGEPLQTPYQYKNTMIGKLKSKLNWRNNWISQYKRMNDIMINQQRALRKRKLMENFISPDHYNGAYWGIDVDIESYPDIEPLVKYNDKYKSMERLPTQLRPFTKTDRDTLINWSYALTDAALRSRYNSSLPAAISLPR